MLNHVPFGFSMLLPMRSCYVATFLVCAEESFFAVGAKVGEDFQMLSLNMIQQHFVRVMRAFGCV